MKGIDERLSLVTSRERRGVWHATARRPLRCQSRRETSATPPEAHAGAAKLAPTKCETSGRLDRLFHPLTVSRRLFGHAVKASAATPDSQCGWQPSRRASLIRLQRESLASTHPLDRIGPAARPQSLSSDAHAQTRHRLCRGQWSSVGLTLRVTWAL